MTKPKLAGARLCLRLVALFGYQRRLRLPRARPGMYVDALRRDRLAAFRADHHRIEQFPAALVLVKHRAAPRVDHVAITPVHDRHDDRVEIEAPPRQAVFRTLSGFL